MTALMVASGVILYLVLAIPLGCLIGRWLEGRYRVEETIWLYRQTQDPMTTEDAIRKLVDEWMTAEDVREGQW